MSDVSDFVTPADLSRELGHDDGPHPGRTVRLYLRERYPDRVKYQRWQLTPQEADDVRRHFGSAPQARALPPAIARQREVPPARSDATGRGATARFDEAVRALRGPRWAMADAASHVPNAPGLYAIYGDESAWTDLGLVPTPEAPLYVGKAEDSLVSRDLNAHFAIRPGATPQTGSSTVRRSLAALLRGPLGLHAVPRNPANPGHFSNYGLADDGDARLNAWMHSRLTLAVWPLHTAEDVNLADIERMIITAFTPPLNISQNPGSLERLRRARADMAVEAALWRPNS